jgi:thioredoxin-related protein
MKQAFVIVSLIALAFTAVSCEAAKKDTAATPGSEAQWLTFDQALAKGASDGKFIVVDFYTDWCKWCKVLDQKTYPDPAVQAAFAKDFVLAKVNPEKDNGPFQYLGKTYSGADLQQLFKVDGYPSIIFLEKDGTVIGKIPGFVPPEAFIKILNFIASGEYKKQSLDNFVNGM